MSAEALTPWEFDDEQQIAALEHNLDAIFSDTDRVPGAEGQELTGTDAFVVGSSEKDEEVDFVRQLGHVPGATNDPVRDYLRAIGQIPLLNSAEKEVELAKRIEAGLYAGHLLATADRNGEVLDAKYARELAWLERDGQEGKQALVEANLRLVVNIAKRYRGGTMDFLDLIQEGNAGLVHAVELFDYKKGYKFSTYATWWIRQAVTRAIADQSRTIRVPVHMHEKITKIRNMTRTMTMDLGREPTPDELAREMGIKPKEVLEIQQYDITPTSIHKTLGDDGTSERLDVMPDEADGPEVVAEKMLLKIAVDDMLSTLSEKESEVLRMRHGWYGGQPMTLDAIGRHYGQTRERMRQIESIAMRKLKNGSPLFRQLLEYLD